MFSLTTHSTASDQPKALILRNCFSMSASVCRTVPPSTGKISGKRRKQVKTSENFQPGDKTSSGLQAKAVRSSAHCNFRRCQIVEFVAAELEKSAKIDKMSRKAREEKALLQKASPTSTGDDAKGGGKGTKSK